MRNGVIALAGEPRMRHVHARPGARDDVLATWRRVLGDHAWVITGDDAVRAGLFGPIVTPLARSRIGDVLAIARDGSWGRAAPSRVGPCRPCPATTVR